MAEMERDIAQTIYGNLKDFKIEMPHNYIGGSGGGDSGKLTRLVVGYILVQRVLRPAEAVV